MKIILKFLREKHLGNHYYKWFTDKEVTKHTSHGIFSKTEEEMDNFLTSLDSKNNCIFGIFIKKENNTSIEHVGNIALQNIDWINRSAELAIIIGNRNYWGKGVGKKACALILEHGFYKLGLNRIWTGTSETNKGMRKVAMHIGMKHEGTFRQGKFLDGKFVNIFQFAILKEESEYIKRNGFCVDL